MRRKKKALRDPPGPTLDTLRSFFKPAPISSLEKKLQVLPKKGFAVLQKEFEDPFAKLQVLPKKGFRVLQKEFEDPFAKLLPFRV